MCDEFKENSVLLVDCERQTRILTRTVLEQTGFSVKEAGRYDEALELWRTSISDVVLLNLMKAPEAGLSLCRYIRRLAGGWREPILAMIWVHDEKVIESAFEAGATDIVTMPCHCLVLHFRLRCAIRIHGATELTQMLARKAGSLTQLPDRRTFEGLLGRAISSAKETSVAIFFMEIEQLQDEARGGDEHAAEGVECQMEKGLELFLVRLTSRYFPIGQLGRNRFSLVVNDVGTRNEAKRHASSIIDDLKATFRTGESRLPVAIKIGLSIYPADGRDALSLLKKAEIARYSSDIDGKSSWRFYRPLCNDPSVRYDSLMIT
jgi:PleD family two-component response regulator